MNKTKIAVVALFGAITLVAGADEVVYACPKEPHHHHYDGSIHIGGNCVGIKQCDGRPERVVVVEKVVEPAPHIVREVVVAPPPPPPRPLFNIDLCFGHKHHHPAPPPPRHPAPRPPAPPHHHHR